MHAPSVQRRREESAFFPFERLLGPVLMPHAGLAFAVENVNRFFEHVALWIGAGAGRDLTNIRSIRGFSAFQVDDGAFGAQPFPRLDFSRAHIGNKVTRVNGYAFTVNPLFVGRLLAERLCAECFRMFEGAAILPVSSNGHGIQDRLDSHHSKPHSEYAGGEIPARDFSIDQLSY